MPTSAKGDTGLLQCRSWYQLVLRLAASSLPTDMSFAGGSGSGSGSVGGGCESQERRES